MPDPYLTDPASFDWLGFATMVALLGFIGLAVSLMRLPRALKLLVYAALALRLVGSLGRHYMVTELYTRGDSHQYFHWGRHYAELLWSLDFEGFFDDSVWSGSKWWGTQFVRYVTGFVVAGIGDSFLGAFVFFSLCAFLGLVGFVVAFHRTYPDIPVTHYARWVWLFPSLWFWPSSIGKEAIILMGLGLAMWGFAGKNGRINWPLLATGIFFIFAIRVQVAAVVIVALLFGYWLSSAGHGRWTLGRVVQACVLLMAGTGGIYFAMQHMGIESFDADGITGYLEDHSGRGGSTSGSTVENAQVGLAGIPMALVNILLRPFPWEARNPQSLLSALEILGFWLIVLWRRREFAWSLRNWHRDRLLQVAVPFTLVYAVSIGMLMANMGIIARQRIFLFPFLFLMVEAGARVIRARQCVPADALAGERIIGRARERRYAGALGGRI